jgi:hypothetical protein
MLTPMPVNAQTSGLNLYVSLNPTTVLAGEWARVTGVVINNSASSAKITVTFSAVDPCGTKMSLGYNRLSLGPGEQVLITTAYPTSPDACRGTHVVTMSTGGSTGKGKTASAGTTASANLEVQ